MEVRETAACGISEREFAIDLEDEEIEQMTDLVNASLEAEHMDKEVGKKVLGVLEENEGAAEIALPFLETEIATFYQGIKAATEQDVDHDEDLVEDLFSYLEQVVGSALND